MQRDPQSARFFIALLPPPAVQAEVTTLKQHFQTHYHSQAALRSPPHITLQPPFAWALADLPRLQDGIRDFARSQPGFPIQLSGFGAFPPRVIFIAVATTPALMTLQTRLITHLGTTLGIADPLVQKRRFVPHMTVAFRDLKPDAFQQAWPEFSHRPFQANFVAPAITLLRHDGDRWLSDRHYPFANDG